MADYDWRSLDALMRPRSVAVIGASPDGSKYPGKVIMNLGRSGFPGKIYPVNPKYDEIFGIPAYKSVADLPEAPDVALLLVGARNIPSLLDQLIALGTRAAIVYASGMAEASETGAELQAQIAQKAAEGGVRLLGPNCLGCIDRDHGTWLSGAAVLGREVLIPGPLAMVTQSGGIMGSFLDRAMAHGVGFTKAVATGNEADINVADCIGYFAQDSATKAIAAFTESIRDIAKFTAACTLAAENGKPVVLMKTGRSERGKRVTQGHTAAVPSNDAALDALFASLGVIRVEHLDDLFLIPNLIVNLPSPRGNRVAVISASGGLAGLAADLCDQAGVEMAEFSDATSEEIRVLQAGYGGCFNPLDITGQVVSSDTWWQVRHMHELLLKDANVDVVISGQAAGQYADQTGIDLVEMAQAADKPLVPFWTGREVNANGLKRLRDANLPVFEQAEATIRAVKASVDHAAFLRARDDHAVAPARLRDESRAAAMKTAADKTATAVSLYALPTASKAPTLVGTIRFGLHVNTDDQVGPFLTLAAGRHIRHALLPKPGLGVSELVAGSLRKILGNKAPATIADTLTRAVEGFSALGTDCATEASAELVFGPDGAFQHSAYAVTRCAMPGAAGR